MNKNFCGRLWKKVLDFLNILNIIKRFLINIGSRDMVFKGEMFIKGDINVFICLILFGESL